MRYNDIDWIEAFAAGGDVAFVYGSYYLELAGQEGGRFPRRQDVPPSSESRAKVWPASCAARRVSSRKLTLAELSR